jgi:hypothetical protein
MARLKQRIQAFQTAKMNYNMKTFNSINIMKNIEKINNSNHQRVACINGSLVNYDYLFEKKLNNNNNFVYLGEGTISSIDGFPYKDNTVYHFYSENPSI